MKARIIKKNTNKKITDYISVGDRITDVGFVCDENRENLGVLISTGCATKTCIHFESSILIPPSSFDDENVFSIMLDKLTYGKYILCTDEYAAEFVSEIKNKFAADGIKIGEIFTYRTEEPQEIEIEGMMLC